MDMGGSRGTENRTATGLRHAVENGIWKGLLIKTTELLPLTGDWQSSIRLLAGNLRQLAAQQLPQGTGRQRWHGERR